MPGAADKFLHYDDTKFVIEVPTGERVISVDSGRATVKTDWLFKGSGNGQVYGSLYVKDNAVATVITGTGSTNKVQFTNFNTVGINNMTTPSTTNAHITVDHTGDYEVLVHLSVESVAGAGAKFGFSIYKNDGATEVGGLHTHRELSGGGSDVGAATFGGGARLNAADTLELWLWNEDNTQNILIEDANIFIKQVGG